MTTVRTIHVEWETDGEYIEDLPTLVYVPTEVEDDEVSDWLSDNYGWLVLGWDEEGR